MLDIAGGILLAIAILFLLAMVGRSILDGLHEASLARWTKGEQQGCFILVMFALAVFFGWLFG